MHVQSESLVAERGAGATTAVARTAALVSCIVLTGAAVMIYEFVAVRILARYCGGSLDAWASVITVLMAALSAGYALGGFLADKYGSMRPIGVTLVVAGITGMFMELIADAVGQRLLGVERGLMWHPYIVAALASFVPVLALGGVLPQVIRLRAGQTDRLGSAAGWMAAISTVGSVLGVLVTVHILLPRVGLRETLYGTSGVLIVAGIALLPFRIGGAAASFAAFLLLATSAASAEILYDDYSAYHHILVEDAGNVRTLRFDSSPQSTMAIDNAYVGGFEYTDFFHAPLVLDPTITSVLFVGVGGGTGPKVFLRDYPQMRIEAVEIDPAVVQIATTYFALPADPRLHVATADGRVYLQRSRATYGAIIMDAYGSGPYGAYLPSHLVTQEFFRLAWQHLNNGGSLIYNVVGVYSGQSADDETVRGVYSTLTTVFQAVYAFQAKSSENTVFIAQKIDANALKENGTRDGNGWPRDPWLKHPLTGAELKDLAAQLTAAGVVKQPNLAQRLTQFSAGQGMPPPGPVYTDDFAPVDIAPGARR